MATKRKKSSRKLSPELQAEVRALRKAGYIVYFNRDGSMGYAPRQKGASKGHLVKPKYGRSYR